MAPLAPHKACWRERFAAGSRNALYAVNAGN
jgi:hypothetical protein